MFRNSTKHTDSYSGIQIEGDQSFIAKTKKALRRLSGTSGWDAAKQLKCIRQGDDVAPTSGGYLQNGTFHVGANTAAADLSYYASTLVHEGAHIASGHIYTGHNGAEAERIAFTAQAKALREMGAEEYARWCDEQAVNPTHQWGRATR